MATSSSYLCPHSVDDHTLCMLTPTVTWKHQWLMTFKLWHGAILDIDAKAAVVLNSG